MENSKSSNNKSDFVPTFQSLDSDNKNDFIPTFQSLDSDKNLRDENFKLAYRLYKPLCGLNSFPDNEKTILNILNEKHI